MISMTRIAAITTGAALVLAPVAIAAPAEAGGCVTGGEFRRAKNGMSKATVATIFGTGGKRSAIARAGGYVSEVRTYNTCSPYGSVAISYMNGRVQAKSGVF